MFYRAFHRARYYGRYFLISINDLAEPHSHVRLYADECCIYRNTKCTTDSEQLQKDSVISWLEWLELGVVKLSARAWPQNMLMQHGGTVGKGAIIGPLLGTATVVLSNAGDELQQ